MAVAVEALVLAAAAVVAVEVVAAVVEVVAAAEAVAEVVAVAEAVRDQRLVIQPEVDLKVLMVLFKVVTPGSLSMVWLFRALA
jgi:hypothetical protein